jgi:hypothetical protein
LLIRERLIKFVSLVKFENFLLKILCGLAHVNGLRTSRRSDRKNVASFRFSKLTMSRPKFVSFLGSDEATGF